MSAAYRRIEAAEIAAEQQRTREAAQSRAERVITDRRSNKPVSGAGVLWVLGSATVVAILVGLARMQLGQDGPSVGTVVLVGLPSLFLIWLAWLVWSAWKSGREVKPAKAYQNAAKPRQAPEESVSCSGCARATRIATRTGRVNCLRCGRSLTNRA